jgi:hypothetical protein
LALLALPLPDLGAILFKTHKICVYFDTNSETHFRNHWHKEEEQERKREKQKGEAGCEGKKL